MLAIVKTKDRKIHISVRSALMLMLITAFSLTGFVLVYPAHADSPGQVVDDLTVTRVEATSEILGFGHAANDIPVPIMMFCLVTSEPGAELDACDPGDFGDILTPMQKFCFFTSDSTAELNTCLSPLPSERVGLDFVNPFDLGLGQRCREGHVLIMYDMPIYDLRELFVIGSEQVPMCIPEDLQPAG